jgi:hypothetical protein
MLLFPGLFIYKLAVSVLLTGDEAVLHDAWRQTCRHVHIHLPNVGRMCSRNATVHSPVHAPLAQIVPGTQPQA